MEDIPPEFDLSKHPNDAFFKTIFSDPKYAVAFFKNHLPAPITQRIHWPSLAVLSGNFVKSNLQQLHTDLLFSVDIEGRETLLYLLFEHQSKVDPTMPLRLLGYISEILSQKFQSNGLPLPPVLPFVFHQGPDAWNVSTAFEDLFDLPEEIATDLLPYLPKFHHALLDLSRFNPVSEEDDVQLRIILQLMKLARERNLLEFFRWLASDFSRQVSDRLLGTLLLYALHADSEIDIEQIFHTVSGNKELETRTMSVAEKLIAKGVSQGISQGISQGVTQGVTQGVSKGLWIGKILVMEELLEKPPSAREHLEVMSPSKLEELYQGLHSEYGKRLKRP